MKNDKTPTVGMAGAFLNVVRSEQIQDTLTPPKKQAQCNDCKYYRWALHKKRGTHSFCAFTGEETSPVMNACEFAEVDNG